MSYANHNAIEQYFNRTSAPAPAPNPVQKANNTTRTHIANIQLQRYRTDIGMWRAAIAEAEMAYFPQRIKMQRIFIDTILNGHVEGCWSKRKDLTLLRNFKWCNEKGEENPDVTAMFRNKGWFNNFIEYSLDAQAYGYSLISLGDLVNNEFPDLTIIKRWHVSPDRKIVTAYEYMTTGIQFLDDEDVRKWNVWVPTPTENAMSDVGNGFLYKVAMYEIIMRNLIGFNTDYAQNYGQPIRVGKTMKPSDSAEYNELWEALVNMGSDAAILMDMTDEITLVEAKNATGGDVYQNLEERCEKKISKIILGHGDAMDSTPGKLGSSQGGEESPTETALRDKQTKDGQFIEALVNKELAPRLRGMGFNIPDDLHFEYINNEEKEAFRKREDQSNQATATVFETIVKAGGKPDWKYFTERTGIEVTEAPKPEPIAPNVMPVKKIGEKIQNKLNKIYG